MPRRRITAETGPEPAPGTTQDLRSYADRLEALEVEKRGCAESINILLQEAVDHGLHKKALRAVVKRRLETADEQVGREAFEDSLDDMLARLGMLRGTPLGDAAEATATRVRH